MERAHRTLKNALRCNSIDWPTALPIVSYGLRTATIGDSTVTSAELVYGRTLRIPGEFCENGPEIKDETAYLAQLRNTIRKYRPTQINHHLVANFDKKTYINKNLFSCVSVYVRTYKVKLPQQAPYDGPYKVLKQSKKFFTLEINGKPDTVTIDWLKPAYVLDVVPPQPDSSVVLPKSILRSHTSGKVSPERQKRVTFYKTFSDANDVVAHSPIPPVPRPW